MGASVSMATADLPEGPSAAHLSTIHLGSPEGIGMQAAFAGNVVGDVRTGCLTLGSGGALAVWPEGFYALDNPPRVMRPNGEVAVRVGERIRMGGGIPDRRARRCGTTLRWIVSEVEPLRD